MVSNMPRVAFDQMRYAFKHKLSINSLYSITRQVAILSGIEPLYFDCCPNSCLAYIHSLTNAPCALRLVLEREERNLAGSSATFLSFLGCKTSLQMKKLLRSFCIGIIIKQFQVSFPMFLTANTTKSSNSHC